MAAANLALKIISLGNPPYSNRTTIHKAHYSSKPILRTSRSNQNHSTSKRMRRYRGTTHTSHRCRSRNDNSDKMTYVYKMGSFQAFILNTNERTAGEIALQRTNSMGVLSVATEIGSKAKGYLVKNLIYTTTYLNHLTRNIGIVEILQNATFNTHTGTSSKDHETKPRTDFKGKAIGYRRELCWFLDKKRSEIKNKHCNGSQSLTKKMADWDRTSPKPVAPSQNLIFEKQKKKPSKTWRSEHRGITVRPTTGGNKTSEWEK